MMAAPFLLLPCNSALDYRQICRQDFRWRKAALAQGANAECVMALGQAAAFAISDQSAMKPGWIREAEGAVEQDLARRGLKQVGAADDFSDAHRRVISDARELIARNTVPPVYDEVAKVLAGDETLRTKVEVMEVDRFAVGHAKAPVGGERFLID